MRIYLPQWFVAKVIGSGIIIAAEYSILFEIRLNLAIGEAPFYVGRTSWLDRQFYQKPVVLLFLKVMLLITGFCMYFYHELLLEGVRYGVGW